MIRSRAPSQDRAAKEVGAHDEVTDGRIAGHELFEAIGRYLEDLARPTTTAV